MTGRGSAPFRRDFENVNFLVKSRRSHYEVAHYKAANIVGCEITNPVEPDPSPSADLEDRRFMLKIITQSAVAATSLALALAFSGSATAETTPNAVAMLFETKHITGIAPGTELLYKFERKPSDEKALGPGFTDDIKVKVESEGKEAGKKNVLIEMYTGERARDPNRITDMDGNPMLVVYLDTALGHFRQLAGGNQGYLKDRFSKSFIKDAKVDPVKVSFKGQDVDGYRITVTPFINDPSRSKMRGYQNVVFSIVVSDKIPGHFAKMTSNYANQEKAAPTLEEHMTLEGVGAVK